MRLIERASSGLVRQLDVLADKSLMTAFLAQSHEIKVQHVKPAITDSGIKPRLDWRSGRNRSEFLTHCVAGASAVFSVAAVAVLVVLGWQALRSQPPAIAPDDAPLPLEATTSSAFFASVPSPVSSPAPTSASAPVYSAATASVASSAPPSVPATTPISKAPAPKAPTRETPVDKPAEIVSGAKESAQAEPSAEGREAGTGRIYIAGVKLAGYELLEQRVEVTKKTVAKADQNFYTIQLFATDNIQPDRMERFLARARGLVDLSNLYVHTVKNGEQAKFIVTYGIYTGRDEATMAVSGLPEKYQSTFQPELHTLSELN
jgi:septal ring-binding cell division protein DamX